MNVDNARRLVAAVRADLIHFDMSTWGSRDDRCGTVMCAAGWAATLAGDPPAVPASGEMATLTVGGASISAVAAEWLGLGDGESDHVFYGTAGTAEELAELLADAAGVDARELTA